MLVKQLNKKDLENMYIQLKSCLKVCLDDTLHQTLEDLLECQKRLIQNKG